MATFPAFFPVQGHAFPHPPTTHRLTSDQLQFSLRFSLELPVCNLRSKYCVPLSSIRPRDAIQRCHPDKDTERTVVSCLELSVALEVPRSGGEGSCASSGGAARAADGIQHSLPGYSVSALILAGAVPRLPQSEARDQRQRLPGIASSTPQGQASSSSALPTPAPTNLMEAARLLGTARPCPHLLCHEARKCFQQCGGQIVTERDRTARHPPAVALSSWLGVQ